MFDCFISNNFYREQAIERTKGRKLTKEEREFYGLNKFLPNMALTFRFYRDLRTK